MGLTQVQIHTYFIRNLKCVKSWKLHLFFVFILETTKCFCVFCFFFVFFFFYFLEIAILPYVYVYLFSLFGDRNASLDFSFLFFLKFGNWKVKVCAFNISWKFQNCNVYVSRKCIIIRYTILYHTENRF